MNTQHDTCTTRRRLLTLGLLGLPAGIVTLQTAAQAAPPQKAESGGSLPSAQVPALFPAQPIEMVREMVTVSHFDPARVRALVDARPSLARAAWDWGFGDWETALGAASHVGNREIAEYLIANGARPSLFSAAMLGQLDVVKAFVAAQPGVQRIPGPHSIGLLAHARAGGPPALPVLRYLESLGDADAPQTAPITDEEMSALTGVYAFGSGPTEQIAIAIDRGQLTFTRKGATARVLRHLGNHVFHPAGAARVRIVFAGARATGLTLTVHDPDLVLTART
jgi:hypothetical protein